MIAIPAVDIRDGYCVQLAADSSDAESIRIEDPPAVARRWDFAGFRHIHIVDLDAATGRDTANETTVRDTIGATSMEVQVAGGIQTDEQIERLLNDGAHRIVLGTRAIHDPDWLSEMADQFPGSLLVAADVRDRHVVTHGWSSISDRYILDLIEDLNDVALAGVLVTSVARAGSMLGADVALIEEIVEIATHPVCARGGIGTLGDLRALEDRGAASVVIGMALYTGALTPEMIAAEFAE